MTVSINGTTGITSPSINTSGQKMTSAIFRVNAQLLSETTTIGATENASTVGPLEVASGVTLTVTSGGTLAVI
tara:strand:- start:397 stop:615 length:219 start_codon:yes stop_codon:yes gene_type:complete